MEIRLGSKLKGHSTAAIENAIAKALSELTGTELRVQIDSLEFDDSSKAEIRARVALPART
ncbi:Uncharacterised protein [Bordetella ansorpii]|uniref:Uncharacterized protein n=1 Tax=Bordetella ansorpii TaxID=288768 RepID=A0A157RM11_9BORD|nr:hypothetical protein [Bordetella ansorpii]SAI58995.1 Uncharacterised protein [Bordetella ansorpii]